MSLNVRGLMGLVKWRYLHELVKDEGVGMICLQETKMEQINKERCSVVWVIMTLNGLIKAYENGLKRILIIWSKDQFSCFF